MQIERWNDSDDLRASGRLRPECAHFAKRVNSIRFWPIGEVRTVQERPLPMPITIYGTDWCDDTRRTRAFLAAKGLRPRFVDIDARPEEASSLALDGTPLSIPVVIFDDGSRLDEPTEEQLEAAFGAERLSIAVHHRTKISPAHRRFEQYRNDHLVTSADFVERDRTIVIVRLNHHEPHDPSLADENVERLTAGLVEILHRSNREVTVEIASSRHRSATVPAVPVAEHVRAKPKTEPPRHRPTAHPPAAIPSSPEATTPPPAPRAADTCSLTQRFSELWSSGADHRDATRLADAEGVGRLAVIKGLHTLWEMPLTPEAMALAFGQAATVDLAAMFHVLGWIIEQNPTSTMSEFQAFDDATGLSIKTQALSLAQRPRDTIALVDRLGPGLQLRTIDEQQAREMAAATIGESNGILRIQDQSTLRLSFGWIFLYQSVEYLETGDYSTMISGNAPLLVDRFTGALWLTGTEERPSVYAARYISNGTPVGAATALS